MAEPQVIYGGPYASESDAIKAESTKKRPNYAKLTEKWPTISQGALDYINDLKHPSKPLEGEFSQNVVIDYDQEDTYIPEVADFDQYKEKAEEIMDKANATPGPDQPEAKENPHLNVEDDPDHESKFESDDDLDKL